MSTNNLCSVTSQKQFDMAVKLARLATELDDTKNGFKLCMKIMSARCVTYLHLLAQVLAGERVGEIYAPDEEETV